MHLIPLGLSIEQEVTNNLVLVFDFGAGFSFIYEEINDSKNFESILFPYISLETRYYTNLIERQIEEKRTDYYSGAYGTFKFMSGLGFSNDLSYFQVGPLVGFQSIIGKSGYWDIGIGIGSTIIKEDFNFGLIGNFKLGFIIKYK